MESYYNNPNSCRICFENEENSISIFSDEAKKLHLQAKIRKYLYITITVEDNFPKIICRKCVKTVNWIHKFATMAVKTQDKFSKLLSNIVTTSRSAPSTDIENHHSLLHSYLTQDKTEKMAREESLNDTEITEMEVRIDPMLILQYREEYDSNSSSNEEENSSLSSLESELTQDTRQTLKSRKPYECSACPRRFTTQFALQSHLWSHSSKERKVLSTTNINRSQIETECATNDDIDEDGKNNSIYSCSVCGKILYTKEHLRIHLESHQPKGKYGCDICGRIFKTETNLSRHKEYHEGLQHPCSVCGRVYPTNSTLRAHSITHSDIRPHKCHVCDKTFKRNQDLKFHINQHTGARPYQCPYCPKAFASSGNCFSHRKRMHPQQVERDREKALLN